MREYYALIFADSDYGSYAKFPDLPGCVALSESFDEAPSHAAEVLYDHLADIERNGDPIPEPSDFAAIIAEPGNLEGLVVLIEEANKNFRPAHLLDDKRWN